MRKLLILAMLCPFLSMCQPLSLEGKIINTDGEPVSNATITVQRTGVRTTSNSSGVYNITNLALDDTVVITAVGYTTAIEIYDNSLVLHPKLTTVLAKKMSMLDDIMIIAYGSTTRRLATGTVSRVTAAEIARQPVTNPLLALQDRVPGLVIAQTAGMPGAAVAVQMRGRNSIGQGNSPLFIIDGVPLATGNDPLNLLSSSLTVSNEGGGLSPFSTINPSDIESIEVLKDADATAIYGSRGGNGVILITTKKGRIGKSTFTMNASGGTSKATRLLPMMNTAQYLQMRREAFANDGVAPTTANAYDLLLFDTSRYSNFSKEFFGGTAQLYNAQVSASGGTLLTRYTLGGSYNRETTIFPGSMGANRTTVHFRLNNQSANKRFSADFSANYSAGSTNLVSNNFSQALLLPPNYPSFYNDDGSLRWIYKGISLTNPYAYLLQQYEAQTANLLASLQLSYQVSKKLVLKTSIGYNRMTTSEESKNPKASFNPTSNPTANASFGNSGFQNRIIEPQATYSTSLGKGTIQWLGGATFQENSSTTFYVTGSNYANDALLGSIESAGSIIARRNSEAFYKYSAFFTRISYNYNKRYLLNFSARSDGSSRFGPGRQWGSFGAAGGAWIFSEEAFAKKWKVLSFGKLRASWGTTGNDKIGDYQYLNTWSATVAYNGNSGLAPTALFNPDYRWEATTKLETGIDLGFLEDRILLNIVAYRSESSNQLLQYKLPIQTGFASVIQNFPATVVNSGIEAELTSQVFRGKALNWSTTLMVTVPRNCLERFPGIETSSYSYLVIGQPLSVYSGYLYQGVNPSTGVYELADKNGKIITAAISNDRVRNLGNTEPRFYGSWSNTISIKGWEVSALLSYKKGEGINYLYQIAGKYPGTINNLSVEAIDRWQHPGDKATFQKYTQMLGPAGQAAALFAQQNSDGKYSDASYLRLRNLSISYNLSSRALQRIKATGARLYLLAQNLVTITDYRGADPENQNFLTVPPLRTITAGFQFTF